MNKFFLYLSISISALLFSGCAVETFQNSQYYTVQSGDTLAKIAATYNLNYQALARQNKLQYPYKLKTGQVLYVGGGAVPYSPYDLPQRTTINNVSTSTVHPLAASGQIQGQTLNLSQYAAPAAATSTAPTVNLGYVTPTMQKTTDSITWFWPVTGNIVQGFGAGPNLLARGVQISVPANSKIYAAANGQVIFSGLGTQNYGQMIIIKHDNNFLTAYTNVAKLLVQSGQNITAGEVLAISGNINNVSLVHFEVRKFGSPVNPLLYLATPSSKD
jgi:lipoprotein NlpD